MDAQNNPSSDTEDTGVRTTDVPNNKSNCKRLRNSNEKLARHSSSMDCLNVSKQQHKGKTPVRHYKCPLHNHNYKNKQPPKNGLSTISLNNSSINVGQSINTVWNSNERRIVKLDGVDRVLSKSTNDVTSSPTNYRLQLQRKLSCPLQTIVSIEDQVDASVV